MKKQFLLILLLLLSVLALRPAAGQVVFAMELPKDVEESPEYRRLLAEKEAHWRLIREEVRRFRQVWGPDAGTGLLRQLTTAALTGQEESLRQALARLPAGEGPAGLDTASVLRADRQLRAINRRLEYFGPLKKYRSDLMAHYVNDAALPHVRQELAFYAPRPGERIGEIGAGDERFAAALTAAADSLTLFVNDIDTAALLPIAYHVQHNPAFTRPGTSVFPIIGTPHSTGLENARLDRIIIRNALHHFDYLPEMLASIQQALAPGGAVFLMERYREDCDDDCCDRALPGAAIKAAMMGGGFELLAEEILTDVHDRRWRLLKYRSDRS